MSDVHPPFGQLVAAGERLTGAGHLWGLGGSGLLLALGLTDHVGDWDLQTDASADACQTLAEFTKRYPKAAPAVQARATAARATAKCAA